MPEFNLEMDLGDNGGKISFQTIEEFEQWIAKERQFVNRFPWNQFNQQNQPQQYQSNIDKKLNDVINGINQIKNNNSQDFVNGRISEIKAIIEPTFKNHTIIFSESAKGRFLQDKLNGNSYSALISYLSLTNWGRGIPLQQNQLNYQAVLGYVDSIIYERGISEEKSKSISESLKILDEKWRQDLQSNQSKFNEIHSTIHSKISEINKWFEETSLGISQDETQRKDMWKETLQSSKKEIQTTIEEGKKLLDDIKKQYDEHMTMAAPVTYWSTERDHFKKLIGYLSVGIATELLVFGLVIYFYSKSYLFNDPKIFQSTLKQLTLGTEVHLLVLVLIVALFIWIIKITFKYFVGLLHLEVDAGERVVMAKTYLALIKDAKITGQEDRHIILEALFRPAITGLVQEDEGPTGLVGLIAKLLGSK